MTLFSINIYGKEFISESIFLYKVAQFEINFVFENEYYEKNRINILKLFLITKFYFKAKKIYKILFYMNDISKDDCSLNTSNKFSFINQNQDKEIINTELYFLLILYLHKADIPIVSFDFFFNENYFDIIINSFYSIKKEDTYYNILDSILVNSTQYDFNNLDIKLLEEIYYITYNLDKNILNEIEVNKKMPLYILLYYIENLRDYQIKILKINKLLFLIKKII